MKHPDHPRALQIGGVSSNGILRCKIKSFQNGPVYEIGVADRGLDRDAPAERITDDVDFLKLQLPGQRGNVVRQKLEAIRAIYVSCVSVSLGMWHNHSSVCRQFFDDAVQALRDDTTMEENHRLSVAVNLVVDVQFAD